MHEIIYSKISFAAANSIFLSIKLTCMLKNLWNKILVFKKKSGKKFWIILLVLLVVVWKMFFTADKSVAFKSQKTAKGDILETLTTTGTVKADEFANMTFQSGGRLAWVKVKKGDTVKKGQPLAGLDTVVLNAAYQQAVNNYRNYQAAADSALDSVKGHTGDETYSQRATRTAAEVARDNAYDAMNAALQNLRFANLYAPFDGIVAEATPSFAGANVTPATASFIVVNPGTVYFDTEIAETDLPKVKPGQRVIIKLDAYPDESIEGKVGTIGVVAFTSSTGGNAYSVRIELPKNLDFKYKVGMEGDVSIVLETLKNVLKVSTSALINEDDTDFVWVWQNGKVSKKAVGIGGSSDEETEIKTGLNEGDIVISEPSSKFTEGQKVKI